MASSEHFKAFTVVQTPRTRTQKQRRDEVDTLQQSQGTLQEDGNLSDDLSETSLAESTKMTGNGVQCRPPDGPIEILGRETASIIRELLRKADILSTEQPQGAVMSASLEIEHPYNPLLLILSELVSIARQDNTAIGLRNDIQTLLEIMLPPHWDSDLNSSTLGSARITNQKDIIERGKVRFSELKRLFLPGELVYTRIDDKINMEPYEQCWIVKSCKNVTMQKRRKISLEGIEWAWQPISLSIVLQDFEALSITEYVGEKDISLSDLGVVPLKTLTENKRIALRQRLMTRGKSYIELCRSEGMVWDYEGPATRFAESRWPSIAVFPRLSRAELATLDERKRTNSRIRTKVALVPEIMSHEYRRVNDRANAADVLITSECLAEETYLILSGVVLGRKVPDCEHIWIHIDKLQPIAWNTERFGDTVIGVPEKHQTTIRNALLFKSTARELASTSSGGLITLIRAQKFDFIKQAIEVISEQEKRTYFNVDLFDYLSPTSETMEELTIFFQQAVITGSILCFHNVAYLLQKRSFKDPKMCYMITSFFKMLAAFPGVTFLFVGLNDEIDIIFGRLKPQEICVVDE